MTGLELMTTLARIPHLSNKRTITQSLNSFETGELFLAKDSDIKEISEIVCVRHE